MHVYIFIPLFYLFTYLSILYLTVILDVIDSDVK